MSNDQARSRRDLLGAWTALPASPWGDALARLHRAYGDDPVALARTREGRALSLARYHRAEEFLPDREPRSGASWYHFLYFAGITAQLGLSAHLLDVGFPDAWCAQHIGLRVAKSLAYANASGLGYDSPEMARLADALTPYWKWNRPSSFGERPPEPDDGGFTPDQVRALLRALLDHVRYITGHPRPNGRRSTAL